MLAMCFSTAPTVRTSAVAIPAFERPSAMSPSTSSSRWVSSLQRALGAPAGEELRDDFRVECGAPFRHAANGVDEVLDVEDAILQQVADPAAAGGEQLGRVGVLDVLRDDEDRHLRHGSPQLERGAQALVAEARRQADVDDRDVGLLAARRMDQCVAVGDGVDDREAVVAQQPGEPVAEQREVFGDQDSHGSSARSVVPPSDGLTMSSVPSSASTRRRRPVSPDPAGSAPPRPSSVTSSTSDFGRADDAHLDSRRLAVLGGVRQCFRGDEVGGGLDRRRGTLRHVGRHRDRDRAAIRQRRDRGLEPAVRQHGRVDPARQLAELAQRLLDPGSCLADELTRGIGIRVQLLLGHSEIHAERNQPCLCSVMQVALDAPQFRLLHVDGAGSGRFEILDALLEIFAAREPSPRDDHVTGEDRAQHDDGPDRPERSAARRRPTQDEEHGERRGDAGVDRNVVGHPEARSEPRVVRDV